MLSTPAIPNWIGLSPTLKSGPIKALRLSAVVHWAHPSGWDIKRSGSLGPPFRVGIIHGAQL